MIYLKKTIWLNKLLSTLFNSSYLFHAGNRDLSFENKYSSVTNTTWVCKINLMGSSQEILHGWFQLEIITDPDRRKTNYKMKIDNKQQRKNVHICFNIYISRVSIFFCEPIFFLLDFSRKISDMSNTSYKLWKMVLAILTKLL